MENILAMLETMTFPQVAARYGYDMSIRNGGTGIRQFLQKNGIDPRRYAKPQAKPVQKNYGFTGRMMVTSKPTVVRIFYENGLEIKRYGNESYRKDV